jgi:dihydrofolate reductase
MILSSIVAMGKNRVIGKDNQMMWSIPSEYKFYRKCRSSHYFIIGRKNYQGSLALHSNELALVLTRKSSYQCHHPYFSSIEDAAHFAFSKEEKELFIIGGSEIYELAMPYIHRLYLSTVDYSSEGDAYFPPHEGYDWKIGQSFKRECDEETPLSWEFQFLEKEPQITLEFNDN